MAEKSQITNHPINQTLGNILRLFDDSEFRDKIEGLGSDIRAHVRAIELFSRQTREFLESASDDEVSLNGLRQVQKNLQNVWNELSAFNSNGNEGHITNASSNLDGALSTASWAFFRRPPKGSKAYGETIESVRNAAQSSIKKLKAEADALSKGLAQFSSRLDENAAKAKQNEERLAEVSNSADAHLSEITAEFAAIKTTIEEERQKERAKREAEFQAALKSQSDQAEALVKRIETHEAQAKKIVQIVGNIGLTGNFQKRSKEEGDQANLWRIVTVCLFGLGVILVATSLISNIFYDSPVDLLLIRMAIGIAIALPAVYTAKESARHRTNADRAKQIELELASLTPFIENLPEEDKWKIVASLTPVYFSGERAEPHDPSLPLTPERLLEIVNKLSDKIPG